MKRFALFALVACAHAFIAGLTAVAVAAGLDLDGTEAAIVFSAAMVIAAIDAAADILVGFLTHGYSPQNRFLPVGIIYFVHENGNHAFSG